MIRKITLFVFLIAIGALALTLSRGSQSENTPDSPPAKSADQAPPTDSVKEPGKMQEGEITDADRILRLESSIGADKKQLAELETELKKAQADEDTESAEVRQLATQIEDAKKLLQQAKDSANASEAEKQQTRLSPTNV